jgi:hypothetical protein
MALTPELEEAQILIDKLVNHIYEVQDYHSQDFSKLQIEIEEFFKKIKESNK